MRTAKVSIGLPVRNGARYLDKCLQAVLAQEFTEFEVIISDNASTDSTPDICEDYARRDDRIRYIRQKTDIGANGNFPFVVKQAHAQSFMWLACDDYYESPNLVGALYEHSRNGAALAFPAAKHLDVIGSAGAPVDHPELRARFRNARDKYELVRELVTSPVFPIAIYGMFNLDKLRGLQIDLTVEQDMTIFYDGVLLHRIIAATDAIEFVDDVFFVYCRTPGSTSTSTKINIMLRDYARYLFRIPKIYGASRLSAKQKMDLALRMGPSHAWSGGILLGAWMKRNALNRWSLVAHRGAKDIQP